MSLALWYALQQIRNARVGLRRIRIALPNYGPLTAVAERALAAVSGPSRCGSMAYRCRLSAQKADHSSSVNGCLNPWGC